ncbi:MAG: 16S rRNA (cytidine(1402)-2'-O)-methyltransferase [Caldisericia bacterium]|nr:16S rRNA (cytidine(1402)-2'-O)-methyltransferase [Caldisericia bacterium]
MFGKLYIVSTPIGNLSDITIRALKILREVEIILCEDTRVTIKLLNRYRIKNKKLISYFEGNEAKRKDEIIDLLKKGKNVALVSDAGTPCVSDPGEVIVKEAIKHGILIEVIPGPSSIISSLIISGLKTTPFIFLGFFPRKKGEIEDLINKYFFINGTIIFYESPHRILKTLKILKEKFPERNISIIKELTKINEKVYRGKLKEVFYEIEKSEIKGEYVILIEGIERKEWEKDFEILKNLSFSKEDILKFMTKKYKGIKNILKRKLYED